MSSPERRLRPGERPGLEGLPQAFGRILRVLGAVVVAALAFAALLAVLYLVAGLIGEWRS